MKIYALGTLPEHYTGWGGIGAPALGTLTPSNSTFNNGPTISMNTSVASGEPGGWGWGCGWLPFTAQVTDVWFSTWGYFNVQSGGTESQVVNISPLVFHFSNGNYLFMRVGSSNNSQRLILSPSLTDSTKFIDLAITYHAASYAAVSKLNFHISGCGTTSGKISWYNDTVLLGTWTGDLTDYPAVVAASFHRDVVDLGSVYMTFAYGLASDYCLLGHTLSSEIISGTAASRKDWVGDVTSFTQHNTNYTTTDGLYATHQGDTVSFAPTKTYSIPSTVGAQIGTVVLQGGLVSDVADATVAAFVMDGASTASGISKTLTTSGNNLIYDMPVNPITNAAWVIGDVNAAEIGFTRTDSDVNTSE